MHTNHEILASQQPLLRWFDLNGSTANLSAHTQMCEVYSNVWDHNQSHFYKCYRESALLLLKNGLQVVLAVVAFCSAVQWEAYYQQRHWWVLLLPADQSQCSDFLSSAPLNILLDRVD